ncbi:MAG TPA: glycosyltransferase family 4 protein [Gammaproteobacteria bacterium]|nr:glycosyltransferase family 4 protein [Gammaproteobacteria bacterium]
MSGSRRILFFENNPAYFVSHRLALAQAVRGLGYEVHVASLPGPASDAIRAAGFEFHPLRFSRSGMNPFGELLTLWRIHRLYRELRPALVYQVTIKPVIYGTLAARSARLPRVVSVISGLGYFAIQDTRRGALLRSLIFRLYRFALRHSRQKVIFHNPEDREVFVQRGILQRADTEVVPGSGVDTAFFKVSDEPAGVPVVVLPARMLRDKGVQEFVAAARQLRATGVAARFLLAGPTDPDNPAAIPEAQLRQWTADGGIEWLGQVQDMRMLYASSNVVCLPSYREGMAKVLLEAAASGRAVVTTDAPGCRDAVLPGETGLVVAPRDSGALAAALRRLIDDGALRRRMGQAGRRHVEAGFSVGQVIRQTTLIFQGLLR